MDQTLFELSQRVGRALKAKGAWLATAESCTGGWVAKVLTDVPGSSGWVDRGFVTYTNEAKQEMLGVSEVTLREHGAVSEQTVREMAAGALARSRADVVLAISGIAGPGGATPYKPVGTVWLAWAERGAEVECRHALFAGDREAVRRQAVVAALEGVLERLDGTG